MASARAVGVLLLLFTAASLTADTFIVTSTADSGAGSLRKAIEDANAHAGADAIAFSIPGSGVQTITPLTPLPAITGATNLDGGTQPGFSGTPIIVLSGASVATEAYGIVLEGSSDGSMVRGLVLNGWSGAGVRLLSFSTVAANYIGTDATGSAAVPNKRGMVASSYNCNQYPLIGGFADTERNVISGNTEDGILAGCLVHIYGNYIGTNATGTAAVPNGGHGVAMPVVHREYREISGNVISGNGRDGIYVQGTTPLMSYFPRNWIAGNYIGVDATGMFAIPNRLSGIELDGSPYAFVYGNVISGNGLDGITFTSIYYWEYGNPAARAEENWIGIGADGSTRIGNGRDGVRLNPDPNKSDPHLRLILRQNVIRGNGGNAITMIGDANPSRFNVLSDNGGMGIDQVPIGAVNRNDPGDVDGIPNYPILQSLTISSEGTAVRGVLHARPATTYAIDFFDNTQCDASGSGEAERLVATIEVVTDAGGSAAFSVVVPEALHIVTASATATSEEISSDLEISSELSPCRVAAVPSGIPTATPLALAALMAALALAGMLIARR